jgi:chitin disaccharide deacetylase
MFSLATGAPMTGSEREITLIINADDYGLSDGVCLAVGELAQAGAISSTTLMIAADGARARYRSHIVRALTGRVGVHLQLTGGTPLSPAREVPSLVGADRRFGDPRTRHEARAAEVELEWRRQIEAVGELIGDRPSHLDSHHGVHRLAALTPVYLRLAREFGLPVRGAPGARAQLRLAGVAGTVAFVDDWSATGRTGADLRDAVLDLARREPGERVYEVIAHPGYDDEYLSAISGLNAAREQDLRGLSEFAALRAAGELPLVRVGTHREVI